MNHSDVILELPVDWFNSNLDGERHQRFYLSIWQALSELGVSVRPVQVLFGSDDAPRLAHHGQLVISFHSRGPAGHVLRLKEAYVPPYYTADRMGYSGFSELACHPDRFAAEIDSVAPAEALAWVETLRQRLIANNMSKYAQAAPASLHLPDPYVFFPLQTADDPVAALCDINQLDALETVLEAAEGLGWGVVVKRHPLCRSGKVGARLDRLSVQYPQMLRSGASVHQLLPGAAAVIGANSGVLFEGLIQGAHVISFGASDFRIATTPVTQREEIAGALIGRGRIARHEQCAFLFWYLTRYCLRSDDVGAIRDRIAGMLAELDHVPDALHGEQRRIFEHVAERERARRNALRDL